MLLLLSEMMCVSNKRIFWIKFSFPSPMFVKNLCNLIQQERECDEFWVLVTDGETWVSHQDQPEKDARRETLKFNYAFIYIWASFQHEQKGRKNGLEEDSNLSFNWRKLRTCLGRLFVRHLIDRHTHWPSLPSRKISSLILIKSSWVAILAYPSSNQLWNGISIVMQISSRNFLAYRKLSIWLIRWN